MSAAGTFIICKKVKRLLIQASKALVVLLLSGCTTLCKEQAGESSWTIGSITFNGNTALSRSALLDRMRSRAPSILCEYRFDRSVVFDDLDSLRRAYEDLGYYRARIGVGSIVRDDFCKSVAIEIDIDEGERTLVRSVSIEGAVVVDDSVLLGNVEIGEGDALIDSIIEQDALRLERALAERGLTAADVTPLRRLDPNFDGAAVTFFVEEGPKVIVGEIIISDLGGLRRGVVLRELTFSEGDTLTLGKLRSSRRRLLRTGLFTGVAVEVQDTSLYPRPGAVRRLPVYVDLLRQDDFGYRISAGFDPFGLFVFSGATRYQNLFGLGHRIELSVKASSIIRGAELSYGTQRFPVLPVRATITGFAEQRDEETYKGFFGGGNIGVNAGIGPYAGYRIWWGGERSESVETPPGSVADEDVEEETTLSIGGMITLDSRKSIVPPVFGLMARLQTELAGLGGMGTTQYLRLWFDVRGYVPVPQLVADLFAGVNFAYVTDYGRDEGGVPPQVLLAIGQGPVRSVRGYERDELGPRNIRGEVIGAEAALVITVVEMRIRLYKQLYGAAFVDAGNAWREIEDFDLEELRWTTGPGFRLVVSDALFAIDYGFKLGEDGDGRVELTVDVPLRF
ncbi:MAG: BamA/TamA family outer membrane protein [Chitinivibrionales bacterium]|nr:BamA/TamA family outer membrane protein [Chitinivibrionales bacterium]MBD3355689.1 BamA/TamA family outer membrane protein [Chitinivibrionales bacterium]